VAELAIRGRLVPGAPEVSIVIPVLDDVRRLSECLMSLARLTDCPSHEVVVVANGTDESALESLPRRDALVLVRSSINLGFGGGCNWGAAFARGRFLVFLNDDTVVEPDWLRALVEVAESDDSVGAVGSRLINPDGTLQEAGSILWSDAGTYQVGSGLPAGTAAFTTLRQVDYCSACGLLVRREAWDDVDGFDERYFPAYHEDVDLCLSLRERGWRVVYAPDARLVHHGGVSLSDPEWRRIVGLHSGRAFREKWGDALAFYAAPPQPGELQTAVEAAVQRAQRRAPGPRGAPSRRRTTPSPPTEVDLLRSQVRALEAARVLQEDTVRALLSDHAAMERLRRLGRRLPFGRRIATWLFTRLTGHP
jgi:GT2 family glycosyltransferase